LPLLKFQPSYYAPREVPVALTKLNPSCSSDHCFYNVLHVKLKSKKKERRKKLDIWCCLFRTVTSNS